MHPTNRESTQSPPGANDSYDFGKRRCLAHSLFLLAIFVHWAGKSVTDCMCFHPKSDRHYGRSTVKTGCSVLLSNCYNPPSSHQRSMFIVRRPSYSQLYDITSDAINNSSSIFIRCGGTSNYFYFFGGFLLIFLVSGFQENTVL